jgi:molecular chaperone GrpE
MMGKHAKMTTQTSEKSDLLSEQDATNLQEEQVNESAESVGADNVSDELCELQKKYDELNDSHLRLMAEYDNYRKRTLREKADLIKTGGESALTNLLPVIDDMERALKNVRIAEEMSAVVEGIELIYSKFISYLAQQGVKAIETEMKDFDTEHFEAIATIPAPAQEMKGKVLDCVQTGYVLYDKVIRHAKVVVGE